MLSTKTYMAFSLRIAAMHCYVYREPSLETIIKALAVIVVILVS